MLRPAKLFHSFHQLRHYVQTKVTELVVAQPLLHPTSTTNAITPFTHQTKPLTHGLQRQFPLIGKACSPLMPSGGLSSWRPSTASSWHRGISLGIHGQQGLGAFRSYSTSPIFQTYHTATHTSVLSHLSSGIFAPLANNVPATKTSQATAAPCRRRLQEPQANSNNIRRQPVAKVNIRQPEAKVSIRQPKVNIRQPEANANVFCTKDDLSNIGSVTVLTTCTCFYVTLDFPSDPLSVPWTKEVWPLVMAWKERQQDHYDQLLAWLRPYLDKGFRLQWDSTLRLYFPTHAHHMVWMDLLDRDKPAWVRLALEQDTITVDEPLAPLGPDYFQGIHLFLSHIDDLVHHGPAFAQSCSG